MKGGGGGGGGGQFWAAEPYVASRRKATTINGGNGYATVHEDKPPKTNSMKTFCKAVPYLWPKGEPRLRLCVVLALVCLVLGKAGDLITPIALKWAVDDLSQTPMTFPGTAVLMWGLFRFGSGFLQELRDILFTGLSAHIERTISLETFTHLQHLSLQWHLHRKTGAVLRSVSRGSASFSMLLKVVLFQLTPVFIQMTVVCAYMFAQYDWYFAVITFVTILLYFIFTFATSEWRNRYRRILNKADNEYNQKATDAMMNFETVKYFNAESHEQIRFDESLQEYKRASILWQRSLSFLNIGQSVVITAGIVSAMYLAAKRVVDGSIQVGDWVLIQAFILQLYQPLGFLGMYYQMIKQNMIDVESMFELLAEAEDVIDKPNATELVVSKAEIKFEHVDFSYGNGLPILKDITFTVEPGQKVAVVGSTGAGKSTIARLLYRFYEVQNGRITVDGVDIREVTQVSLRKEIGIVPQDCVLFNESVGYNIGYGIYGRTEEGATSEQIEQAAKSAAIHEFVMTQKELYDTKVGERGLRLSGGEKQRVAIARAILKRPRIMIFDEATSSLDTHTEKEIQISLDAVAKGRSSITIAHRLSTIMNADKILVLVAGRIAEQGTHDQLLALNGVYRGMWDRQKETAHLTESLALLKTQEKKVSGEHKKSSSGTSASSSSSSHHPHPLSTRSNGDEHDAPMFSPPTPSTPGVSALLSPAPIGSSYIARDITNGELASPALGGHVSIDVHPSASAVAAAAAADLVSTPQESQDDDELFNNRKKGKRRGGGDADEPLLSN